MKFRVGTGATAANIYAQEGEQPSEADKLILIGVTADEARVACELMNAAIDHFKAIAEIVAGPQKPGVEK